jgi:hypothetical protein
MQKRLAVAWVLVGLAASVVLADEASHRKTALELLEITETKKMLDQVMASVEGMMAQQLQALELPPEGQEAAKAVQKDMMGWFSEFFVWEEMRDLYLDVYVEVFTEDELKELIQFYQSPLGQKLLNKMPALMQKSMQKTQAMLQKRMPEFQERLQKTMSELREKYKQDQSSATPGDLGGK